MTRHPGSWVIDGTVADDTVTIGHGSMIGILPQSTVANRRVVDRDSLSCIRLGARTVVGAFAAVYLDAHIGEDCRVGDHVTIREGCRIGNRCVIGTNANLQYDVILGDDVRILDGAYIVGGTVIGDGSFIAPGVMMANDPHIAHFPLSDYRDRGRIAPVIGRYVFVGAAAIILPGVTIRDGAVIAAGALVTHDVVAGAKMFGSPARNRLAN